MPFAEDAKGNLSSVSGMRVQLHRAGGDLVQVGLPDVRAGVLDHRDLREPAFA